VPWLDTIRSESVPGRSSIDLTFEPGTDVLHARQMVQEHLTQAHALPAVGTPPVMIQPLSSTGRVMMIGLTAKDLSPVDLSILARWKIKPRLMGLPGVANVAIWGQRDRQLQVRVHPDRLRAHGVSLDQVINTTGNALWVSPLTFVEASTPGTGGFIDTTTQRFAIQHILPITTSAGLAAVSIEGTGGTEGTRGRMLRLGEVASVVEDHQPLIGDAVLGDGPGLMMVVEKFPEANTLEVTREIDKALAALKPGLSGVRIDAEVYRPASFLSAALGDLGSWGLLALVLVVVLLGAVMLSWRVAVVGTVTIALSLIAAASVLYLRGTTFNLMVLAGLVAGLVVVIDDAVVCVDAVRRSLRERRTAGGTGTTVTTVAEALADVRRPLLYGTVVALLAPLPAVALAGVAGSFARPFLLSYVLAVVASTVVALTVTPALAVLLLGGEGSPRPAIGWLGRAVDRSVPALVSRPRWVYAALAGLLLVGVGAAAQFGGGVGLPSVADPNVLIHWHATPGTSLGEMTRITAAAAGELRAVPGIRAVGAHVGRAVMSNGAAGVDSGEMWVRLTDSADHPATVAAIRRVIRGYPGMRGDVVTYPEDRVRAAQLGTGVDLLVRVYGADLTVLRGKAAEIRRLLSGVDGVVAPTVETQDTEPTLEARVDLVAARRYGIKPGDVRRAAATFFAGLPVGSLYEEQKVFDVVVWSTPTDRHTPADLADLLLDTPSGGHVRLGEVATVRFAPAPTVIRHDNISRSLAVTASVQARGEAAVRDEVRTRLAGLAMPLEYHAEVVAPSAGEGGSWRVAALALGIAVAVLLVFQAAFDSWRLAGLLFLTLPLAAVGGLVTGLFAGDRSGAALPVGLLMVLGFAARNGLLVVHALRRRESDGGTPGTAGDVTAPIVLTAVLAAAVLLPLVFWGGAAGATLLRPMAVVVLGGLVTSTVVSLLAVPALYHRLSRERPT
jgi:Cu/Ag efflux pump CusA